MLEELNTKEKEMRRVVLIAVLVAPLLLNANYNNISIEELIGDMELLNKHEVSSGKDENTIIRDAREKLALEEGLLSAESSKAKEEAKVLDPELLRIKVKELSSALDRRITNLNLKFKKDTSIYAEGVYEINSIKYAKVSLRAIDAVSQNIIELKQSGDSLKTYSAFMKKISTLGVEYYSNRELQNFIVGAENELLSFSQLGALSNNNTNMGLNTQMEQVSDLIDVKKGDIINGIRIKNIQNKSITLGL